MYPFVLNIYNLQKERNFIGAASYLVRPQFLVREGEMPVDMCRGDVPVSGVDVPDQTDLYGRSFEWAYTYGLPPLRQYLVYLDMVRYFGFIISVI